MNTWYIQIRQQAAPSSLLRVLFPLKTLRQALVFKQVVSTLKCLLAMILTFGFKIKVNCFKLKPYCSGDKTRRFWPGEGTCRQTSSKKLCMTVLKWKLKTLSRQTLHSVHVYRDHYLFLAAQLRFLPRVLSALKTDTLAKTLYVLSIVISVSDLFPSASISRHVTRHNINIIQQVCS